MTDAATKRGEAQGELYPSSIQVKRLKCVKCYQWCFDNTDTKVTSLRVSFLNSRLQNRIKK